MPGYEDGHTALDSTVIGRAETQYLKLVLVRRSLDEGKEDQVVHGASNSIIISSPIGTLNVLSVSGFKSNRSCLRFNRQGCMYRIYPIGEAINLQGMADAATTAAEKMREAERSLENCGWSMINKYLRPIREGHRAAQKEVLKTSQDDLFRYVMTYTKDEWGEGRFVTHFIPKQGPDFTPEMIAVMEWLELKSFNGCPESLYKKCFFHTMDNVETSDPFRRPADRAHNMFARLPAEFSKAYHVMVEADAILRPVGLNLLNIKPAASRPVTTPLTMTTPVASIPPTPSTSAVALPRVRNASATPGYEWDAFICHASEDKDRFVRQLARELQSKGLKVWYDEFTLKVGDSLRRSIEKGLAQSKYGAVVLSPKFFEKKWPQDELDGLSVKERDGQKVILPVWLDVDQDYVAKYSPMLADRLATKASNGMAKVVTDLMEVIKPS